MIEHIAEQNLTDAQRLFHGRGHAYPELSHINVDWLSPVVLITLYEAVDVQWLSTPGTYTLYVTETDTNGLTSSVLTFLS